jgi:hypothetical protein
MRPEPYPLYISCTGADCLVVETRCHHLTDVVTPLTCILKVPVWNPYRVTGCREGRSLRVPLVAPDGRRNDSELVYSQASLNDADTL